MRTHHGILALAALTALWAAPGCDLVEDARDRFGTTDTLAVAGSGTGLMLGLQASGTLRAGEEGVLRLAVTNRTDTTVTDIRLELIVPAWAEPSPPRFGDRAVTMRALEEGGTRFSYGIEETPIEPGQTQAVEQRIRVPAVERLRGADTSWSRIVRGRLLDAEGQALAEVEGQIALDTGTAADTARGTDGAATRRDRIGPVRLGMAESVLGQFGSTADTTWTQAGTTRRGVWVSLSDGGRALAEVSGDSVVRIEVRDAAVRTPERVGVGSSLEDLRSAYGTACANVDEGDVVVWFGNAPGFRFALNAPVPDDVARLRSNPASLPGTAEVTRWWVRRAVDNCPR